LATGVVGDLGCAVADFQDEVGDDFVEDADGFGEGFAGEGWVGAWISVCEEKETD
jgi:hypothetical protein